MEKVACNLCGSIKQKELFSCPGEPPVAGTFFSVVKCSDCGLAFLNPRPDKAEMGFYYCEKYYSDYGTHPEKNIFSSFGLNKYLLISKLKKPGRILDIGSQKGSFLEKMQGQGWEVYGVDISQFACDIARKDHGLNNIYCGDILDLGLPQGYFDVVTMWQTIEHLRAPSATLKRIKQLLRSDGLLVFDFPNFDSITSSLFRTYWYGLDIPRHLYQFTPRTVSKMLQKAGFCIRKKSHLAHQLMNMAMLRITLLKRLGLGEPHISSGSRDIIEKQPGILRRCLGVMLAWICFIISGIFAFFKRGEFVMITAFPEAKGEDGLSYQERVSPEGMQTAVFKNHMARYLFTENFISGKAVLDIGCGYGYGSQFMAGFAAEVCGVDISHEAIDYARSHFKAGNVEFLAMDAKKLDLKDASLDVVVAFEMIEHEEGPERVLSEARRLLRQGGVAIISTPNKKVAGPVANPYHIQEYSFEEFKGILSRYFPSVTIYGQGSSNKVREALSGNSAKKLLRRLDFLKIHDLLPRKFYYFLLRLAGFAAEEDIVAQQDYTFSKNEVKSADYLVALCRKECQK